MVIGKLLPLFLLFIFTLEIFPQGTVRVKEKNKELNNLKSEIARLEEELKQNSKNEKKSAEILENYNKQSMLLNKVIQSIRAEEKDKDTQIEITGNRINSLSGEIKHLREVYAKYITYVYKYGSESQLAALLSSASFNQALLRYKYLKKISDQKQKNLTELKYKKHQLDSLKSGFILERNEKHQIALRKEAEESKLGQKLSERKQILVSLRNDKTALKKELDLKRHAENEIRNLISRLVEEEKKKLELAKVKRAELAKKQKANIKPSQQEIEIEKELPTSTFESFTLKKGSLSWPVSGKIIRRSGENKNIKLNTVTLNYGVDIKSGNDLNVHAVAEGIVSTINWVPGYGSVMIITHKNNFRTVYGHLGEIFINEGAKVTGGTVIGKISESLEGSILHFEIWNERNFQNPEIWLSRR